MKRTILLTSLGASIIATVLGVSSVFVHAENKVFELACIAGLFGIASFFVGLAFPVSETVTTEQSPDGATHTRSVVNN